MEAIRKIIETNETEVKVDLPDSFRGKKVEVIILPVEDTEFNENKRTLGLLKDKINFPESFFEPLPDDSKILQSPAPEIKIP